MRRHPTSLTTVVGVLVWGIAAACSSGSADSTATDSANTDSANTDSATGSSTSEGSQTTAAATAVWVGVDELHGAYGVEIVTVLPHDPLAYTQGLEWFDGELLESTGKRGSSSRRWVDPATGIVRASDDLDHDLFGEGITIVGDNVVQLTWTTGQAIFANLEDLQPTSALDYEGEGWGLCFDGIHLVMTNGGDTLSFRDPLDFGLVSTVPIRHNGEPLSEVNELECVNGQIIGNIYRQDELVVIDPATGAVTATIDASNLRPQDLPIENVNYALNGVAVDPTSGNLFLTGKWWPVLYEVRLVPLS